VSEQLQIKLFEEYYKHHFTPEDIVISDLKFRHFRFQLFGGKYRFIRIKDVIESPIHLYKTIIRYIPKNAYYTPVKWLNPIYVAKTKKEIDIMLSFPLYFDIDIKHMPKKSFPTVKDNTKRLIEFIEKRYGLTPDLVVFSGRQGFHVYYWNFDSDLISLSPIKRIVEFKKKRERIVHELLEEGIIVDSQITIDPYRILRIPNTLHGRTGLIASVITDIESFDIRKNAAPFEIEIYEKIFPEAKPLLKST